MKPSNLLAKYKIKLPSRRSQEALSRQQAFSSLEREAQSWNRDFEVIERTSDHNQRSEKRRRRMEYSETVSRLGKARQSVEFDRNEPSLRMVRGLD